MSALIEICNLSKVYERGAQKVDWSGISGPHQRRQSTWELNVRAIQEGGSITTSRNTHYVY